MVITIIYQYYLTMLIPTATQALFFNKFISFSVITIIIISEFLSLQYLQKLVSTL